MRPSHLYDGNSITDKTASLHHVMLCLLFVIFLLNQDIP